MVQKESQFPTNEEIDRAVDQHYASLGASNGRWWDGKPHCSSPTVEARELASFMKAMRDHEVDWREKTTRYEIRGSKTRFQPTFVQPVIVHFVTRYRDDEGNDCDVGLDLLVEHTRDSVGSRFHFFGHSRPPVVGNGMVYYFRGEYDPEAGKDLGEGWIETDWVIKPDSQYVKVSA